MICIIDALDSLAQSAAAAKKPDKGVKSMNFFKKFFELQIAMLQHNAGLTDSHPYASSPLNWPFLVAGISFWTGSPESKEQIYMVGNPISWWLSFVATMMFGGMLAMDQILKKRGMNRTLDGNFTFLFFVSRDTETLFS